MAHASFVDYTFPTKCTCHVFGETELDLLKACDGKVKCTIPWSLNSTYYKYIKLLPSTTKSAMAKWGENIIIWFFNSFTTTFCKSH